MELASHRAGQHPTVYIPVRTGDPELEACLGALVEQDWEGELRVVVSPNGPEGEFLQRLERWVHWTQPRFEVCSTPIGPPGKPGALNRAETMFPATGPSIYLDVDTRLSPSSISCIMRELQGSTSCHLCAPRRSCAQPRSWIARAYWSVWNELPLTRHQVVFCGVYAVSPEGRRRWGAFPETGGEDKFVRLHFDAEEQVQIPDATATVALPSGALEFLRARTRWARNNHHLRVHYPQLRPRENGRWSNAAVAVLRAPHSWGAAAVAFAVHFGVTVYAWLTPTRTGATWDHA